MSTGVETIHRVYVKMGCGCHMYAEFSDIKCSIPVNPVAGEPDAPTDAPAVAEKVFIPCKKHGADPSLEMLRFVIEERLEEKISDVGKAPVRPVNAPSTPSTPSDITLDGVSGATVQALNVRNLPKNGRRPDPLAIKQGGMFGGGKGATAKTANTNELSIDMDGVEEDERVTDLVGDTLGFLMEEDNSDGRDRRYP